MITTDLQPVSTLPTHTRIETITGLAFDVLNGRRDALKIDQFLRLKDGDVFSGDAVRSYVAHSYDVRRTIQEAFDLVQRTDESLDIVIFPYSQAIGVSVRKSNEG